MNLGVCEWLGELALDGARVIELGPEDAALAAAARARGAGEVVPLTLEGPPADLIVMSSGLDRGLDPLALLVACRRALRRDGFLLVETPYLFQEGHARVAIVAGDGRVVWTPSKSALEGMLQLVGFEILGSIAVDERITVLAQARRPSEIRRRAGRVALVHRQYMRYANYRERIDFDALEEDRGAPSCARFLGRARDRRLYPGAGYRHLARSAWFHARAALADARAAVSRWRASTARG